MKADPRLAAKAIGIGLTPIIPLPVVDELLRAWLLRRGIRQVAAEQGVALSAQAVSRLAHERKGCALGCLIGLVWWPIRKFLRTLFYFLTVKECMDSMAEGAIRIEMVRRACEAGVLPSQSERVREVMFETLKSDMGSVVSGLVRHRGAPGHITLEGSWSVRWVYWLVDAGGGVATCDAFSDRLRALTGMEE